MQTPMVPSSAAAAQLTLQQGTQMSERLSAIAAATAYAGTNDTNGAYSLMPLTSLGGAQRGDMTNGNSLSPNARAAAEYQRQQQQAQQQQQQHMNGICCHPSLRIVATNQN